MVITCPTGKIATTLKEIEELTIPPDGIERKFDGVVESFPRDKGCEMLHGELTYE